MSEEDNQIESKTYTYTKYSSESLIAKFMDTVFSEVVGITVTVTKRKPPVYTMGSANPRSFGHRRHSIYGSIIMTDDVYPELLHKIYDDGGPYMRFVSGPATQEQRDKAEQEQRQQLPPFTVTAIYLNDEDRLVSRTIYGVTVLQDGKSATIINAGKMRSFVATDVSPEMPVVKEE